MNKLLYFLLFFSSLGANAQPRPKAYAPNSTTRNTVIVRGGQRIDSVFTIPFRDTTYTPERSGDMVIRPGDNLMYIYIAGTWFPFQNFVKNIYVTNGLTALNDSTIGFGGRLSKLDTISGRGTFGLLFDSLTNFVIRGPTNTVAADASAVFQVISQTKGVIFSKMNTAQMNAISSPTSGLLIFNTDSSSYFEYTGAAWTNVRSATGGSGTPNWQQTLIAGSTLNQDNSIVMGSTRLSFTSTNSTMMAFTDASVGATGLNIQTTSSGGVGINVGITNGTGVVVFGTNGVGFSSQMTTGDGADFSVTDGIPLRISANSSATNSVVNMMYIQRQTSGTVAAGIGAGIDFDLPYTGSGFTSSGNISVANIVVSPTPTSQMTFRVTVAGQSTQVVTIDALGGISSVGSSSGGTFAGSNAGLNVQATQTGTGGIPVNVINRTANTNQVVNGVYLERQGGGNVGAVGEGIGIWSNMVDASGSVINTGQMNFVVSNATSGAGNQITDVQFKVSILTSGETEVLRIKGKTNSIGFTQIALIGNFANNAAALTGGLVPGDVYRNGDLLQVVH